MKVPDSFNLSFNAALVAARARVKEKETTMPAVKNDKEHPTTLHMKVAEAITELAPTVIDKTARKIADDLIDKRTDLLVQVYRKRDKFVKEFDKIRPKPDRFDEDGKSIGPASFTKEDIDKRRQLKDKITKCETAINRAIDKEDYSDVQNLANDKDTEEGSGDTK